MLNGNHAKIFKNIYGYGLRREDKNNAARIMYFYDIETGEDVALYEKLFLDDWERNL